MTATRITDRNRPRRAARRLQRLLVLGLLAATTLASTLPASAQAASCTSQSRATWSSTGLLGRTSTVYVQGCAVETAPGRVEVSVYATQRGNLQYRDIQLFASFAQRPTPRPDGIPTITAVTRQSCTIERLPNSNSFPGFAGTKVFATNVRRCDFTFTNLSPHTTFDFTAGVYADVKDDGRDHRTAAGSTTFTRVMYSS